MQKRGPLFVFLLVLSISIALAAVIISDGSSEFNFNEDTSNLYNITVNNTAPSQNATSNVSQVNITFPSSFSFSLDTNGTSATGTFSNTSTVLSWDSDGLVMNLTYHTFWFNLSAATPGTYNITVTELNSTAATDTNFTVTVNDTTAPNITFVNPSEVDGANLSQDYVEVNITSGDNVGIDTIIARLYNSTDDEINSSTSTSSPLYINFSNLTEGTYKFNVTVNDSDGNENSSATRTIVLDTTNPSVTASEESDTQTSLNLTISITESGSGINSVCTTDRGGADVTGAGNTQTIYEESLTCGTSYTYLITCTDYAGNQGNSTDSFSTESCSSSSGGGGGGTSTSGTTYSLTNQQLDEGITKTFEEDDRFKFKVSGRFHTATLEKLTDEEASFLVESTPQTFILKEGESQKVDVDDNDIYDILLMVKDIDVDEVNVSIVAITEFISANDTTGGKVASNQTINLTANDSGAGTAGAGGETKSSNKTLWTIIILLVIGAVGLGYFLFRRKRKRTHGY